MPKRKEASKVFRLALPPADVFQILDALGSRAESWEYTHQVLSGGSVDDDELRVAEDCSDPGEAAEIASHFRDIATAIDKQIKEQ